MSLCYVGIDNGIGGGICVISETGAVLDYCKMPVKKHKGKNEVDVRAIHSWISYAVGENLSNGTYMLEEPVGSKSAAAAKSMAGSFHCLRGFFETKMLHWLRVTPNKWQNHLLPERKAGETKAAALAKAGELWPEESFILPRCRKAHDGIVDAALIAEYLRLTDQEI